MRRRLRIAPMSDSGYVGFRAEPQHRGASSMGGSSSWSQGYNYEGFGNLTAITGTQANCFTIDAGANHGPYSDANGNDLSGSSIQPMGSGPGRDDVLEPGWPEAGNLQSQRSGSNR
jgi:hypothetical protein